MILLDVWLAGFYGRSVVHALEDTQNIGADPQLLKLIVLRGKNVEIRNEDPASFL